MSDSDALERIENRLDVALLMVGGMSREEAEARVYVPKLYAVLQDLQRATQRITDVVDGYGR